MRAWNVSLTVALAAVAVALPADLARAGVVIVTVSEETVAKPKNPAGTTPAAKAAAPRYQGRLFVDGDRVRLEGSSTDAEGKTAGTVLFRAQPEALLVLDEDEKSYFEVTRADVQRIGEAIDVVRTQMEAQLDKMSPDQRAMLEEALGGFAGAVQGRKAGKDGVAQQPAPPVRAIATGGTDSVSGHTCRGFDVVRGTKKIAEACIASWQDLGLAPADVDGLRKLAAFQQKMLAEVDWAGFDGAPGAEVFEVLDQVKGFPVRVRSFVEGKPPIVMRVVKVERRDLDPKLFQVPAGYARGAMPMG